MWLCCDLYTSSDCLKQETKWWIKCVKVKLDKSSDVAGSSAPTSAGWLFFQTRSLASIKGLLVLTESQHVCVFAATKLRFAPFISAGSWFWTCLTLAWILRAFSRQHLSQQSWIRRMGVDPYEYTQIHTNAHTLMYFYVAFVPLSSWSELGIITGTLNVGCHDTLQNVVWACDGWSCGELWANSMELGWSFIRGRSEASIVPEHEGWMGVGNKTMLSTPSSSDVNMSS